MGEEFYCTLKLVTGEEIFALISVDENDGDPIIILQNPVIMKMFYNHSGSYMKVKPWMEIPDDDIFLIKLDKVVTMTEIKDNMVIGFYEQYLKDEGEEYIASKDGQVKISNKMGYISSVEDARKKLENLFKDSKES
jgi:hypothetical protein